MTTINDIDDLVRILRERPEWLKAIRELVLSEELLRLPETVAKLAEELREFARQTNERLERLEADMTEVKADVAELKADMTEVKAGQAQTNRRLARVENRINDLRGDTFEITAARRIMPELFRQERIYNCDTVIGPGMSMTREMLNDIRRAQTDGLVELNSEHEIAFADLVLRGLRGDDDQPVWIVVEASVKIDEHDITRARQRADILAAVYEEPALAIVAGEGIDDRDHARAADADVKVVSMRPRYRAEE